MTNKSKQSDKGGRCSRVVSIVGVVAALSAIVYGGWNARQSYLAQKETQLRHKTELRPWVFLDNTGEPVDIEPAVVPVFQFNFLNTGQTPALNMTIVTTPARRTEKCVIYEHTEAKEISTAVLGGRQSVGHPIPIPLDLPPGVDIVDIIAKLKSEKLWLHMLTTIVYEDIWGDTHTTEYRLVYDVKGKVFSVCPNGTYAD